MEPKKQIHNWSQEDIMSKKSKQYTDLGTVDFSQPETQVCAVPTASASLADVDVGVFKQYPDIDLPAYATGRSACFDLKAHFAEGESLTAFSAQNQAIPIPVRKNASDQTLYVAIPPGARVLIPTGMIFDIPEGMYLQAFARSGLSFKKGLSLFNGVGVIDEDYVDPFFVALINTSSAVVTINNGDRVAQAGFFKTTQKGFRFLSSPPLQKTNRNGGFGSTGN